MKKIIITKGTQMGSTVGAFMYSYYIQFHHTSYNYTFEATEEGIMYAAEAWQAGGYEIIWQKTVNGQLVAA